MPKLLGVWEQGDQLFPAVSNQYPLFQAGWDDLQDNQQSSIQFDFCLWLLGAHGIRKFFSINVFLSNLTSK